MDGHCLTAVVTIFYILGVLGSNVVDNSCFTPTRARFFCNRPTAVYCKKDLSYLSASLIAVFILVLSNYIMVYPSVHINCVVFEAF